jgi:ATP/maltotriose-dependent transcriptional regulator MalT
LAHALLFQNRFSEAEAVYKELSQTIIKNNETYTKALLKDFDDLEKAGAIPEAYKDDVEKIRKILREELGKQDKG